MINGPAKLMEWKGAMRVLLTGFIVAFAAVVGAFAGGASIGGAVAAYVSGGAIGMLAGATLAGLRKRSANTSPGTRAVVTGRP